MPGVTSRWARSTADSNRASAARTARSAQSGLGRVTWRRSTGGRNIDSRVIEEALLRHSAVTAAAAVGRPDRHSGEVPVAYVVPAHPGRFDEAELLAWAGTAISEPTGGRKTAGRRWHRP